MDQIKIKRLEVFAKHGVLTEENVLGQKFLISATLYCDTKKAGKSDQLEDSVNYAAVAKLIGMASGKKNLTNFFTDRKG